MSATNYRLMTDEQLLDLRHIYRTNLANLELQAASFSDLNVPVSLRNDLDASRKKLGRIDAECRRDLRYVAGALGGGPNLAVLEAALGLLEPVAAQLKQA